MAVIYEIKERRVIPNWRDYKRTLQLGELNVANKKYKPIDISIDRAIFDWQLNKDIGTAADVINSSFVADKFNQSEVREAIDYIKKNENKSSKSLLGIINEIENSGRILTSSNSILELDVDTIKEFQAFINNDTFHRVINKTKNLAKKDLYNPITWIELGRLYSMRGHIAKAEKAILTALQLAPNNRFVLRSATRFFIHEEKFDKAIYYLRKSNNIKNDPWLISAHIATSSIMGRFSPYIKYGKSIIESNDFSDFELTELLSSLGTLEYKNGTFKKAKALFEKSMISPNDNSLAQLEWISKDDNRFEIDPFKYDKVINPFEARALELFERGNWQDAFYNSIKWFLDMPFSKRPALLGSYIAGSLIKDKNAAIILCEVGLQANPHDPTLLNNIVYSIATSTEIDKVLLEKYVKRLIEIDIHTLPDESKITYQATLGLVYLKKGNLELGKSLYKIAIENAKRINNDYLKNLAIFNFTRELITLDLPEKHEYISMVEKIKISNDKKDLQVLKKDIEELIRMQPNKSVKRK